MSHLWRSGLQDDLAFEQLRMDRLRPELNMTVQEQRQSEDEAREARRHAEYDAGLAAYRDKRRIA